MTTKSLDIRVPTLARVEGEGALELDIREGRLARVHLRIYEPPRFFEKLLVGRSFAELPDLLARICGICPVAYQLTAVQAAERAFGVTPPETAQRLRRVLYHGEWIQSHSLHIHLLALPDFFGCDSAIEMAQAHGDVLARGFRLQALGNRLMSWLGGRSVHPVSVCVGGLYGPPDKRQLPEILALLEAGWEESGELLSWLDTLPLPDGHLDCPHVHVWDGSSYPLEGRSIRLGEHGDRPVEDFPAHVREEQVAHSTALQSRLHGHHYLVGPLARINTGMTLLSEAVRAPLSRSARSLDPANPFHGIIARALEIRHCIEQSRLLLADADLGAPLKGNHSPCAGFGAAATEAPRGLLWQGFTFDRDGSVTEARIVPPTSQNQACIEADLGTSLQRFGLDHDPDALRHHAEKVIRNYDPCISCATHFLDLHISREGEKVGKPGKKAAPLPANMQQWRVPR